MTRMLPILAALLGVFVSARLSLHSLGYAVMVSPSDALAPLYLVAAWLAGARPVTPAAVRLLGGLLAALTLWLVVSLLRGAEAQGHWIAWALVNKMAGWFILILYLAAGLTLAGRPQDRDAFVTALLLSTVLVVALSMVAYMLLPAGIPMPLRMLIRDNNRFVGLTENPNAFAFLVACTLMLSMARMGHDGPRRMAVAVLSLLACGLLFAFSRSAWLGTLAGGLVLVVLKRVDWRALGIAAAAAAVAALVLTQLPARLFPSSGDAQQTATYITQPGKNVLSLGDTGVQERVAVTMKALESWREQPVLGIGLGVFLDRQHVAHQPVPATIHTTMLWLLAETGLVGAGLAVILFAALAVQLWRGRAQPLAVAALAMLVTFAAISLFNEMLYQRSLWCLVGLGLGCAAMQGKHSSA